MKTKSLLILLGAAAVALWALPGTARGQIYVASTDGTIGEYNLDGTTINASLVSGLSNSTDVVVSGGNLYVANSGSNTIGEYNATTGAAINASLVSGLNGPLSITVFGGNLYVANIGGNTIGEYNATTGATINAALVSGLNAPIGVAEFEGNLFVASTYSHLIGEYDAITGATINASLVSGLDDPYGLDVVPDGGSAVALLGIALVGIEGSRRLIHLRKA